MKSRSSVALRLSLALLPGLMPQAGIARAEGIYLATFAANGWYLTVELLDDDLAHVQFSHIPAETISTSPMIARTDYAGPTEVAAPDADTLQTPELRLDVAPDTLCVTFTDRLADRVLTTLCPTSDDDTLGMTLSQEGTTDLYGLGEMFQRRGGTEGNWIGKRRLALNLYGNELASFNGGHVENAQFPILYALGAGTANYALFLDDVYQQYWDFSGDPFTLTTTADALRAYILTGPDLPDLRRDYLELTGRPPVPPRQMFGLWVSEFGYESWDELLTVLDSLEDAAFPVDGFVLDLQWFGGVGAESQMGSLSWDEANFPDPAEFIASLRDEYGVGVMTIEESYVSDTLPDYADLAARGVLVRQCGEPTCDPVRLNSWWGTGGMVDWTDPDATAWWQTNRRQHLVDEGVVGHWTDLGEPEDYAEGAWYHGFQPEGGHTEADVHNVYNLFWAQSIWEGYQAAGVTRRPFILSRSGTTGIQRYGASMWSGDIAANMPSLEAQMNVQMHLSLSGIDYFGSDVGGFYRQVFDPVLGEAGMYTVWLANSALLDVPLRPHAFNLQNRYPAAPSLIGDVPTNLANVRLRYALSPYLYTLAHRAYRNGEAMIAPLVYGYQADPNTRPLGSHKLLGPDLLMASLTGYALETIPVYLPAGGWFNYHTGEYVASAGEWFDVPTTLDGTLYAPLFVRDGAILPQMIVDDKTMNQLGQRRDGSAAEIEIAIYRQSETNGSFTLIEDDGTTLAYQDSALRETTIAFETSGETTTITIGAALGTYDGAPDARRPLIRLVTARESVAAVTLDDALGDTALPALDSQAALDEAETGWYAPAPGMLLIRPGRAAVDTPLTIQVTAEAD